MMSRLIFGALAAYIQNFCKENQLSVEFLRSINYSVYFQSSALLLTKIGRSCKSCRCISLTYFRSLWGYEVVIFFKDS
jgi:hypothetical protein